MHNDVDGLGSSKHTNTNADENVCYIWLESTSKPEGYMACKFRRLLIAVNETTCYQTTECVSHGLGLELICSPNFITVMR